MGRIYDLRESLKAQKFKIDFGDMVSVDFADSGLDLGESSESFGGANL